MSYFCKNKGICQILTRAERCLERSLKEMEIRIQSGTIVTRIKIYVNDHFALRTRDCIVTVDLMSQQCSRLPDRKQISELD